MYLGKDYSAERKAADDAAFLRMSTTADTATVDQALPGLPRRRGPTREDEFADVSLLGADRKRKRPVLSEEERAAAAEKRRKHEEDVVAGKEAKRLQRVLQQAATKARKWAANGYTSTNLRLPGEQDTTGPNEADVALAATGTSSLADSERDFDLADDARASLSPAAGFAIDAEDDAEEDESRPQLECVYGDVTMPDSVVTGPVIIVHVCDDSGDWGRGGVFSALSRLSGSVEAAYTRAGEMDDLRLGDAHVIDLDGKR